MRNSEYVQYDMPNRRKRRKKSNGLAALVAVTTVLIIIVSIVFLVSLFSGQNAGDGSGVTSAAITANPSDMINALSATPPAESASGYQNPVLYPAAAKMNVPMGNPGSGLTAVDRGVVQNIYLEEDEISPYQRSNPIFFGDPLSFQTVPGILTFRGNNFRNCASWGTAPSGATTLEQTWEYSQVGSLHSTFEYIWDGTGWTGQPLVIKWSDEVRQLMNMYPEKKAKTGLVEVIQVAFDGKIYFLDLDDGSQTRDPLDVGFTIKGTPCVDPRGYPILYVGQGDNNGADRKVGFRIFSLIDYAMLYYQNGLDPRAYRTSWGACDSSPIVNAESDTLIYPSENGLIYTLKLNTVYNPATGAVTINPENVVYRYLVDGVSGEDVGIESSIAVYDHYGYFTDYTGNLICLDLNTLQIVWIRVLDDDSDVTPVLEEEDGRLYLYTGTEVDWQRTDEYDYLGASYTYKIDAMTGEEIWQTSIDCYTHNGETKAGDVNGGMLGTPIVGKQAIKDLVIFSYCMTNGVNSGNRLVAFNKETGEKVWSYEMNHYSWSSPVDCYDAEGNAYIVICDSIGQVHLVNGSNGQRITFLQMIRLKGTDSEQKSQNVESSPIIFNDLIVVGTRAGSIFGVRIK